MKFLFLHVSIILGITKIFSHHLLLLLSIRCYHLSSILIHLSYYQTAAPPHTKNFMFGKNALTVSKAIITSSRRVVIKAVCGRTGSPVRVCFVRIPISISAKRTIIPVYRYIKEETTI